MMAEPMGLKEFHESEGAEDWRILGDGACAYFRTGTLDEGSRLVQAICALPGAEEQHPDIDLRHDGVTVRLLTLNELYCGITRENLSLARAISMVAREMGFTAEPSRVQSVLIIPGAADISAVMPFWEAALGYIRRPDSPQEDLIDPQNRGPALWFENMKELRAGGEGAIHVAAWIPYDQAESRLAAALAAGGRIVRDDFAPAWWTLADAAGNEVDISTTLQRG